MEAGISILYDGWERSVNDDRPPPARILEAGPIVETIRALQARIQQRFPDSSLGRTCTGLLDISEHTVERLASIARPILGLRIAAAGLVILLALGTLGPVMVFPLPTEALTLLEFVQVIEPGLNALVLIGVAIFFLITLERRIKRKRVLEAIHELRSIAHIIDMHQLTKDPHRFVGGGGATASSPKADLTPFLLARYLDYCSEMLSLTGKIAAIYVQDFDDSVVLSAVNEVESLTTGLSRKIWQKLMILHSDPAFEAEGAKAPRP
ncbi:MAG: hypothetical protein O7H41_10350 [Planctomycetota bacterium]|nr:hypothetical protein [Planctomycetota bacterium]